MQPADRSLRRTLIRYLFPSVAAQWVFALYTMVDGMFVARGVSELAMAAINISMPFISTLFALSLIIAVGASTIISIHFGRDEPEAANRAYTQDLLTALALSLLLAVSVFLGRGPVAAFLGADDATRVYVEHYVGTIACFAPSFMLAYYFEILIKADGRPMLATVLVTAGTVINCVLDSCFIVILPWGIFGAAFATGLAQVLVCCAYLVYFLGPQARLRLTRFRFSPGLLWRTCKLGVPSGITELSAGLMTFLLNHTILRFIGTDAVVSYTIVAYMNTLIVMSMTGIAQGMQPLVSFYHGQGSRGVDRKLLQYALAAAGLLTLVLAVPSWLGAGGIVSLFISADMPELRAYSAEVFRIFGLSFLLVGVNVIFSGYYTAVECARYAILISLSRGFLMIAGCLWCLVTLFGGSGIWWTPLCSEALCLVLTAVLTLRYRHSVQKAS